MYKNILIGILVTVLVLLITMIYLGTPNIDSIKDTYMLSPKEQKYFTELAEDGNVTAMQKLKVHCIVIKDFNCAKYWNEKTYDVITKKDRSIGVK